jgi:hypothetical protein
MLRGQVAVFLSCSEKFKEALAWQVRDMLSEHGLRGLIVTDEPQLPGTATHPEAKVESYLDASSAFAALCTPDYALSDGTTYPRANIIDEIQLASVRPHLRDHFQILKSPGVLLPSSITPTYDGLDVTSPAAAAEVILKQLEEWGLAARQPDAPRAQAAEPDEPEEAGEPDEAGAALHALLADARPGDHDEATRRVYQMLVDGRAGRVTAIALHREILRSQDASWQLGLASLLQAMSRLDASLVSAEMIEALAARPGYPARSCAANLLRDRAIVAPLDVPLAVLGRLASPSSQDWYVAAPAMAAVKELVLSRRDAGVIFESLSASAAPQDRHAVAQALLEVAAVKPAAVPADLAQRLAGDPDPLVAEKAQQVMTAIEQVTDADRASCYGHFAL